MCILQLYYTIINIKYSNTSLAYMDYMARRQITREVKYIQIYNVLYHIDRHTFVGNVFKTEEETEEGNKEGDKNKEEND